MKLFKRQSLWTLVILLLLGGAGHYFLNAYQVHRSERARLEKIRFRHDFVRRQIDELQHKIRVIEQVNAFAGGAEDLGLMPSNWTRYEVNVDAPLRFDALSEIVRQCSSTPYYYFHPEHLKVHLAGQPAGEGAAAAATMADDRAEETGDLLLQLKGTFLARRR